MAGANTIIRLIAAPIVILILMFITAIGFTLNESISQSLTGPPAALGWGDLNMLFFMALGLIGLGLTVVVWLWYAPIREDVRQEQRPPRL